MFSLSARGAESARGALSSDLVRKMKGRLSRWILRELPALRKIAGDDCSGAEIFLVTNGVNTQGMVLQYLEKYVADPASGSLKALDCCYRASEAMCATFAENTAAA